VLPTHRNSYTDTYTILYCMDKIQFFIIRNDVQIQLDDIENVPAKIHMIENSQSNFMIGILYTIQF